MITNLKNAKFWLYGSLLIFVVFAIYLLSINQEVFYTAQERSEFLFGVPYYELIMRKPFGLMQYVGAWLTQFFYEPAIGSTLLVLLWGLIFIVGKKAFKLQGTATAAMLLPIAFLLSSVIDLGYWVYIIPFRGYWFSQSVAYLTMLFLLWIAQYTPRKWHLGWYIFAFISYPILGWFAMLFVLCLAMTDKLTWRELVGLVMVVFMGGTWHSLIYTDTKIELVNFAGFPHFKNALDQSDYLSLPFWLLGIFSLLIPFVKHYLNKVYVPVLSAIVGIVFAISMMFKDHNYIEEMRMARYASDDNWKEVLNIAAVNPKPTTSMVMLKNIALMNEGGLLDQSFKMGNIGYTIFNPDTLHVSFLEIGAPVGYYNYGMINEAFRLNFECAVQSGFSPLHLKMLARCAHANEEEALEKRYTTLLHHHPFYADWKPASVSEKVRELQHSYPDEITGIENSDSYIVNGVSLWTKTESKLASEQALFFSMIRRDSRRFWASLRRYVKLHEGELFPVHAQEAYILFMDKSPEEKKMMIPVSQEIYDRYQSFWKDLENKYKAGMTRADLGDLLREDYGDTYWYYNVFCTKVYN